MLSARHGLLPLGYARATRPLVLRRVAAVDRLDPAAHAFDHVLQRGVDCDALVERVGQLRLASSTSFWIPGYIRTRFPLEARNLLCAKSRPAHA